MKNLAFFILVLFSACYGCTTTQGIGVAIKPKIEEDRVYFSVYQDLTKSVTVYSNLEVVTRFTVTHLSDPLKTLLENRADGFLPRDSEVMNAFGKGRVGFFVSTFSPSTSVMELSNDHKWLIHLNRLNTKPLKPSHIFVLHQKEELKPYFMNINPWSKEFLLVFEAKELENSGPLELVMKSSEADVTFTWQ